MCLEFFEGRDEHFEIALKWDSRENTREANGKIARFIESRLVEAMNKKEAAHGA